MNTVNLVTFVTVMRTKSISLAAEQLFITQPAVSKRIRNLEDEFNVVLFDTIGRGIIPTESAYELLTFAKRWLEEYEMCKSCLMHAKKVAVGKLVIGTSHHIGLHHLSPVLKQFTQQYPAVQLEVQFMDSETAHRAVLDGEVSLAFLTLPPDFDRRLVYHTLWSDNLHFVAGVISSLAQERDITLLKLAQCPAILPAESTFTTQITLEEFTKHNLRPRATMSTNPLESIRMLVSVGLGWSVLPEILIDKNLVKLDIKEDVDLQRHLGVVYNPALTQSLSTQAFLQTLSIKPLSQQQTA